MRPVPADQLVERRGRDIAQLLRGERQLAEPQECQVVLRQRFSYFEDDLVVPAWNAALIGYRKRGACGYRDRRTGELATARVPLSRRVARVRADAPLCRSAAATLEPRFAGRSRKLASLRAQALVIDVNDLTDRLENAVKFTGDVYAARLFRTSARGSGSITGSGASRTG